MCKYCNGGNVKGNTVIGLDPYQGMFYIDVENYLCFEDTDGDMIYAEINYCPMCGDEINK